MHFLSCGLHFRCVLQVHQDFHLTLSLLLCHVPFLSNTFFSCESASSSHITINQTRYTRNDQRNHDKTKSAEHLLFRRCWGAFVGRVSLCSFRCHFLTCLNPVSDITNQCPEAAVSNFVALHLKADYWYMQLFQPPVATPIAVWNLIVLTWNTKLTKLMDVGGTLDVLNEGV